MTQPTELDPVIREILEEVAADPRSALFRVPTRPVDLFRENVARSSSSLWTRAERHLLEVHRAEVARLLYDASHARLLSNSAASVQLCRRLRKGRDYEPPDQSRLSARFHDEARRPEFDPGSAECHLLSMCFGSGSPPMATDLAMASLRLAPRDAARITLGIALHLERNDIASKHYLLSQVLAGRPAPLLRESALQNMGHSHAIQGRWEQALECFASACSAIEGAGVSAANWFWIALRLGRTQTAKEAARVLEAIDDPPSVEAFLLWHRLTQAPAASESHSAPRIRAPQWIESLPEHARRIGHAVA